MLPARLALPANGPFPLRGQSPLFSVGGRCNWLPGWPRGAQRMPLVEGHGAGCSDQLGVVAPGGAVVLVVVEQQGNGMRDLVAHGFAQEIPRHETRQEEGLKPPPR